MSTAHMLNEDPFSPWVNNPFSNDLQQHSSNFIDEVLCEPEHQQSYSSFSSGSSTSSGSDDTFDFDNLPSPTSSDWRWALSQIREQMFTSTSMRVPSPAKYIATRLNVGVKEDTMFQHFLQDKNLQEFNNAASTADLQTYRQHRSENIFLRLMFCRQLDLNVDRSSLTRLGNGVFIQTKWLSSPQQMDDVYSMLMFPEQVMHATPYSYTFGARYTDPYGSARDIVVRGNIPLWCQTIFLAECVRQKLGTVQRQRTGLFCFAPEIAVDLTSLPVDTPCRPELTIAHERIAMELSELDELRDEKVLSTMLFCDIPDDLAQVISSLATTWAIGQGYLA